MDGFVLGVEKYNEVHGTHVQTLGWDPAAQDGLFAGNFESTDDGRTLGESLLDEGADIIMPVAGPVGAGTLAVLEERGTGMIIGVDNDWSVQYANQADIILASALKNMDMYVYETIACCYGWHLRLAATTLAPSRTAVLAWVMAAWMFPLTLWPRSMH